MDVHDADGKEIKIYGVVQDVTAREESRTELDKATTQLLRQHESLLAEHRLAAQLQEIILPLPEEPSTSCAARDRRQDQAPLRGSDLTVES
jgi:hypothetical protein